MLLPTAVILLPIAAVQLTVAIAVVVQLTLVVAIAAAVQLTLAAHRLVEIDSGACVLEFVACSQIADAKKQLQAIVDAATKASV